MMAKVEKKFSDEESLQTLYDKLLALPEGLNGEIIGGSLYSEPRPSGWHAFAASRLGADLDWPYGRGRGGPGGWWIIDEPELHFVRDKVVLVPDLAGWRRERMPRIPQGHRFEVIPDWVCEVLSPATRSKDRELKIPVYAKYKVAYAWLVEPVARVLEAYRLVGEEWELLGRYRENEGVSVAPFDAITIALSDLWC